jgi:hypothetical protein
MRICQQSIEYKNERVDAPPPHLQRISRFRQLPHSQARRRGQAMDCLVNLVFIGLTKPPTAFQIMICFPSVLLF